MYNCDGVGFSHHTLREVIKYIVRCTGAMGNGADDDDDGLSSQRSVRGCWGSCEVGAHLIGVWIGGRCHGLM